MAHQAPREKLLPEGIANRPDAEIAEAVFGPAVKAELDRLVEAASESMPEGYNTPNLVSRG